MDNSEEDAGNATIDSRRLEAREKELRTVAEALATVVSVQDAGVVPSAGDEVSDIDSMSSPGVPDANTSTEAILDMIDEFVDGPTVSRRIQCSSSKIEPCESALSSSKQVIDSTGLVDIKTKSDETAASVSLIEQQNQCIPNPCTIGDSTTITSLQSTIPEHESCENSLPNVSASSILPAETSIRSELPSSSANLTVACTVSCENNVRTVKSVTSSDLSEQIISDSVESSSNDSSVSLNKLEVSTHSPLKRRLVRPAPSDRPPDCTVSSTVDSQNIDVPTSELKSGVCITKDVTSSSDAVPVNVKPEEIRSNRDVSLCQAETSVSPPKKIKLVRPKPPLNSPSELNIKSISSPDNEICQSTSSEKKSLPISGLNKSGRSSTDLLDNSLINENNKDITISAEEQPIDDAQHVYDLENFPSSQSEQLTLDQCVASTQKPPICNLNQNEINTPLNIQPSVSNIELTIPQNKENSERLCASENVFTQPSEPAAQLISENIHEKRDPDIEKRVPPLKLCVQRSSSSINAEHPSENEVQKRVPPLKLTVASKESPKINEATNEDERKVPPIILCKSYESPIRGLADEEKSIVTEKKVPPLIINTQTSEVSPKCFTDAPHTERRVPPLRITTNAGDLTTISTDTDHEKKVPPIKISMQPAETIVQLEPLKINTPSPELSLNDTSMSKTHICDKHEDLEKRVPPIKLLLASSSTFETTSDCKSANVEGQSIAGLDMQITDCKQVPKLTIKIGSQKSDEMKSPVPKLTIKPIKLPEEETREDSHEQIPSITKLNIKPIPRPADKINETHRKSSSSEISESEYSENDEGTSTSDQASASDQGPLQEVPKVTIKLGKLSNQIEPTVPKLTIKGIQNCESDDQDSISNLKLVITQTDEELSDKVPKLTIKNIAKTDQPLSPKLTIKPLKPPPEISPMDGPAATEKENAHIPKITIKPVIKNAPDSPIKTKRSTETVNNDNMPTVTKLNIKPLIKPQDKMETEVMDTKVPIISKLNIKPVLRPNTENEEESDADNIPKITKINIKPIKTPDDVSSLKKDDCFDVSSCSSEKTVPNVTKLNIKPIIKPEDEDKIDSENQSSETGNSSDDADVPVVTKINIKPIIKPSATESTNFKEENLPVVSKLNIKPILNPTETAPLSPRIVTKLNIKPIVNPNEVEHNTQHNENEQNITKNPRLLMKINKRIISESNEKCNNIENKIDHDVCNNVDVIHDLSKNTTVNCVQNTVTQNSIKHESAIPLSNIENHGEIKSLAPPTELFPSTVNEAIDKSQKQNSVQSSDDGESVKEVNKIINSKKLTSIAEALSKHESTKATVQNCKLLKQLLEQDNTDKYSDESKSIVSKETKPALQISVTIEEDSNSGDGSKSPSIVMGENKIHLAKLSDKDINTNQNIAVKLLGSHDISKDITKPLEINTERVASPCSGQDSPRIILKINKTDHGSSAKIITEESLETPKTVLQEDVSEILHDTPALKKTTSTRRKQSLEATPNETVGKRLRSSKVVHNTEQSPVVKRNLNKRQSTETSSQNKQTDMTILEAKRLRLGQILSNKSLTVTKVSPTSPNKSIKQEVKNINHTMLNNENCSKNGNSQLHNIFSNLQAKQIQVMPLNDIISTKKSPIFTEVRKDDPLVSIPNSEEVSHGKNSLKDTEIMINDNSESRDFSIVPEEASQDPLEVQNKITPDMSKNNQEIVMETPTPRKRGRPRKLPVSEDSKCALPTPALEERPQRSLRLSRERPAILAKPRGRGRGRGAKRAATPSAETEPIVEKANKFFSQTPEELDPTSSRVKLPRMTEALDKMPSVCSTPLSSRRHSDSLDRLSAGSPDLKSMMDTLPKMDDSLMRSPEGVAGKRRGPGSRGGKVRVKGRGRGRGGGKGAMYMRETMGIYGRVCGPATTTVELFEEETQMMEDSTTPSKPSHLLDEDSQSSVMSSTNDSSKPKKSKFADLFDSNKVWTASDVKEYTWPSPDMADGESQVMMIQEQVAMFLSVKSFKRRYPELKRRTIVGAEKEYVLSKGLVSEALCDLGITAVEASEVLDIMLSDYPHKYEEYRTYQREKQIADLAAEENEPKPEVRDRIEMKIEKQPEKQEPKVDPEKTRQDMAAAAIASASEFNARLNASRRPAAVDLQSLIIHRRRPPVVNPQIKVQPPGGFYPHALLPGQYQHGYKVYTSEQLRYFPLNTVLSAPPAAAPASPPPSSGSDDDSSAASDTDAPTKRKKLTKTKRTSSDVKKEDEPEEKVDLCRSCNLRLEANRRYTHERFLVCSSCDAKLHPSCLELNADTIRKCREYSWQCVECKCCATCSKKQDDDKMLFCDLCDRGFHIYCVGLADVPSGRWHCIECAVCRSCGAREPGGPPSVNPGPSGTPDLSFSGTPSTPGTSAVAEWHHQTKRGPGGHKVYSHSLCTPCARAYRIGRYCPLCDRSFVGPKGTMQLIICKLCDRQHHKDCVKQTVCNVNVLDYTCSECRRSGITSRSAAVRNAPRTIATLFMAKRRFNKYAHRQYMQSRIQAAQKETDVDPIDFEDECSEDITEVSDPLEGTAPDGESMTMDYGD